jgi:hypothetical protein
LQSAAADATGAVEGLDCPPGRRKNTPRANSAAKGAIFNAEIFILN